jgi:hypothetical protein
LLTMMRIYMRDEHWGWTDANDRYVSCSVFLMHMANAHHETAMDSKRTAQEMSVRSQDTPGIYFRFSVDQGMQTIEVVDWQKLS